MNIYVGNVPYAATEEDLETLFGEYGAVATATIIRDRYDGRSKGFGFVEMENQADGEQAIEALDGQDMMGRPLKVNPARPRTGRRYNGNSGQENDREDNTNPQGSNQGNEEETQGDEEKTHLILTVGTNALPVWVAWFHLKKHLNNPKVGFVYTKETKKAMECLKGYCNDGTGFFDIPETQSGDPSAVRKTVADVHKNQLNDKPIHVHYTGGTQVMGVETVSAIATSDTNNFDRSYLDARSNLAPTVIARMEGEKIGPQDARQGICPDICRIADLNGFQFKAGESEDPKALEMIDSKKLIDLLKNGSLLKYAARAAFKNALEKIANKSENRKNYAVYHDVKIKPNEENSSFELNVVVILGYQVIVVSCSTASNKRTVKLKTIRAYHQAKQFGGDEARVIMLCNLSKNVAAEVQAELYNNIGSKDNPLQVWGTDRWDDLTCNFTDYLRRDLGWNNSAEDVESSNGHEKQSCVLTRSSTESSTGAHSSGTNNKENYLILTVGTEALPIWVAWYHLKQHLDNPKVGFVYTKETKKAMKCLKEHFKCNGYDQDFLDIFLNSPGNPKYVGDTINTAFDKLCNASIHVHYTGGTQVMGVETAANYERSYLDARSKGGPTIRIKDNGSIGPQDARQGVCPDIHRIAELNGFQARNFCIYEGYYSGPQKFERDRLTDSEKAKLEVAQIILSHENGENNQNFSKIRKELVQQLSKDEKLPNDACSTELPKGACSTWTGKILPKLNKAYPNCQWCMSTRKLCPPAHDGDPEVWKKDCKDMRTLLEGIWLEYVALDALERTLKGIKCDCKKGGQDYIRDNYALYRGVYVRRKPDDSNDNPKQFKSEDKQSNRPPEYFELDVVAVLGYQIVVVSCTTKTSKNKVDVREKAMEAYLRAKQLGGDEVRVIMLCNFSDVERQNLETILKDDTGSKDEPLQVWGNQTWNNLSNEFKTYLEGLGWQ